MTTQMTKVGARLGGVEVALGQLSNVDGDINEGFILPVDYGDVLLLSIDVYAFAIATLVVNPELLGVAMFISDASETTLMDSIGSSRWSKTGAATLISSSDRSAKGVFWAKTERLVLRWAEIDTNAAPTGDVNVYARIQRVRPL